MDVSWDVVISPVTRGEELDSCAANKRNFKAHDLCCIDGRRFKSQDDSYRRQLEVQLKEINCKIEESRAKLSLLKKMSTSRVACNPNPKILISRVAFVKQGSLTGWG